MKLTQQSILRQTMQTLGLSRDQFAKEFKLSRRKLDSWLLPEDSTGFRAMNLEMQEIIFNALREHELKNSLHIEEGMVSYEVPIVHCDKFNFDFPTLYRITYAIDGIDVTTGLPDPTQNCIQYGYALNANPDCNNVINMRVIKAEPISIRNTEHDHGWVYITEHRSLDRADSYLKAICTIQIDDIFDVIRKYNFGGHFFSLYQIKKPLGEDKKDCITNYNSDDYLRLTTPQIGDLKFNLITEDSWQIAFEANEKLQTHSLKNTTDKSPIMCASSFYLH